MWLHVNTRYIDHTHLPNIRVRFASHYPAWQPKTIRYSGQRNGHSFTAFSRWTRFLAPMQLATEKSGACPIQDCCLSGLLWQKISERLGYHSFAHSTSNRMGVRSNRPSKCVPPIQWVKKRYNHIQITTCKSNLFIASHCTMHIAFVTIGALLNISYRKFLSKHVAHILLPLLPLVFMKKPMGVQAHIKFGI
jgi:hypothetical protein